MTGLRVHALALLVLALPAAAAHAQTPVYNDPPSYDGRQRAPVTKPQSPPRPQPVTLAGEGLGPHTVVDDAGTAHIVWAEGGDSDGLADRVRYCRLKRGTRACDASATLEAGPESSYNTDYLGPRIVRVGGQLVAFSQRYPVVVDKPDGGSSSTVWAWTSGDGGASWSDPAIVGKYALGDMAVIGPDDDPTILNFAYDPFCGLCIEAYKSGEYSGAAGDLAGRSNDAYYPQIELDRGVPVVSWVNLDGTTYLRRWTGQGSVVDPATWTAPVALPDSNETDLSGGPSGLALLTVPRDKRQFVLRKVGNGFGPAVPVSPGSDSSPIFGTVEQDAGGRILAAWSERNDFAKIDGLWLRTAAAGAGGQPALQPAERLVTGISNGQIDLAGTEDGGGFAVFNHTGGCCDHGEVVAAGFGNQAPNGKKGLGDVPGGGSSGTTCQHVKFGSFTADAAAGCFLHGTGDSSHLVVTGGEINLHGLRIIPEGKSKIIMDPRALRLDTTGAVRVVVSSPLIGEITLWRGEIHRDLSAVRPGTNLFEFPIGEYATEVLGFDVGANVQIRLEKDGVHIPLSLKLPPAFGGFSGNAELISTTARGLILDSLHIELGPVPLGFLVINKVELDYVGAGDIWRGAGSVTVPAGGTLEATVEFRMGDFNSARIAFTPSSPIPIGPFVYLLRINGGFTVEPVHIEAGARIGAGAAINGSSPVIVNGLFEMDFPKKGPANFKMSGTVEVAFFEVGNGFLQFQTDGYAAFGGQLGPFSIGPLNLDAKVGGFVDAGSGQFGADLSGKVEICIDVELVRPCAGAGADVALSNAGFAACATLKVVKEFTGGVRFPWKDFSPEVLANPALATYALITHIAIPCNTDGYRVPAPRPASARVAQAGGTVVRVPGGVPSYTVLLVGDGGAPQVTATGPGGAVVRSGEKPTETGFTARVGNMAATYLVLTKPRAGDWTIVPNQGSAAIKQTLTAGGYRPATVRAKVTGRGRRHVIDYRVKNLGHGQRVVFAERGAFGTNIVGSATKPRGKVRFTIADAKGGRRRILAMVQKDGIETGRRTVGSYRAPGPIRPGKARRLRAARKANAVVVSWRPARGVERWSVTLRGRHGTSVGRFVTRKTRRLRFARIRRDERLTVTVVGVSKKLRRGPAAKTKLRAARR
jgi:hypothetical protein